MRLVANSRANGVFFRKGVRAWKNVETAFSNSDVYVKWKVRNWWNFEGNLF